MRHTDKPRFFRNKRLQLINTQRSFVNKRQVFHYDATFHRLKLPRYDIGVVFHLCDDDLIARLHLRFAERGSHQIDRFCRTTRKDDFLDFLGIDERAHLLTGSLMEIGSLLREIMHPAMHVGIHVEILIPHGIEHHERLLCGSRVIEIHQRLTIHLARQNREICPYLINIKH